MAQAWFVSLLLGTLLLGCVDTVTVGEGEANATLTEDEKLAQLNRTLAGAWQGVATVTVVGFDTAMFRFELRWEPDPDTRSGTLLLRCQFEGCVQGADETKPRPTLSVEGRYTLYEITADGAKAVFEMDDVVSPMEVNLAVQGLSFKLDGPPMNLKGTLFTRGTTSGGPADAGPADASR